MKYYPKIDGLRFVAIFLVLFEHFTYIPSAHIIAGYYGVDLFFIISGFLITCILINTPDQPFAINYKNFFIRRSLRIWPIYYITVSILLLVGLPALKGSILPVLGYYFNYAFVYKHLPSSAISPLWSLSVEEQFYLFWPLIVLGLKSRINVLFYVTVAIVCLGYSQQVFNLLPSISDYNYFGLLTRMGSLGLGSLAAISGQLNLLPYKIFNNKVVEVIVFATIILMIRTNYNYTMFILSFCSVYVVIKASLFGFEIKLINVFLSNRHVRYIGSISYGIYLFHMAIAYYLDTYLTNPIIHKTDFTYLGKLIFFKWYPWLITFPIYSLITIVAATLSYKYIEQPFLRVKGKFRY